MVQISTVVSMPCSRRSRIIYGLLDPRTGDLRYVGKSVNGLGRPKTHTYPSVLRKEGGTHKANWIRQLQKLRMAPQIIVLEKDVQGDLYEVEQQWIKKMREEGWPLTNLTDGGPGTEGFQHSAKSRAKMSKAMRGRRLGVRFSEHHKKKIAKALRDSPTGIAHRQALHDAQKKPVIDLATGIQYASAADACRLLGLRRNSVGESIRRGGTTNGYRFRYIK